MSGPSPSAPSGIRIHGRDVLLTAAIGIGLFMLAAAVIQSFDARKMPPEGRLNQLIALYAAWTFAWLGAIWLVFTRRRGLSFADLGYHVPEQKWAVRAVGFGFAALPVAFTLFLLLRPVVGVETAGDLRSVFGGDAFTGIHAVAILLYAGFLVPIAEELLFRGLLFRWVRQRLDFWPAALITATIFGLAHQRIDQMIIVGLLGLPLAWLTEKSRSLVPAILMHQTYNSLMLMVTFAAIWFQPEAAA